MICTWAFTLGCYQSSLSRVAAAVLSVCVSSLLAPHALSLSYALPACPAYSFLSCALSRFEILVFLISADKQQYRLAQAARAILYIHITLLAFPRPNSSHSFFTHPPLLLSALSLGPRRPSVSVLLLFCRTIKLQSFLAERLSASKQSSKQGKETKGSHIISHETAHPSTPTLSHSSHTHDPWAEAIVVFPLSVSIPPISLRSLSSFLPVVPSSASTPPIPTHTPPSPFFTDNSPSLSRLACGYQLLAVLDSFL